MCDSKLLKWMCKMRKLLIIIVSLFALIIFSNSVNAHSWACLTYGDTIPHYTCYSDLCKLCLDDDGYSTSFGYCKNKPMCTPKEPNNDTDAPSMDISSPNNGIIYNKSKVLFRIVTNEPPTLYYKINNRNEIWKKLSRNMKNYSKEITFRDGYYNITIKAADRHGNSNITTRHFYVDTKKPKVNHLVIEGNGLVKVKFEEANPVSLIFKYGNNISGYKSYNINLSYCSSSSGRTICENFISPNDLITLLTEYNGQSIDTYMELADIAGNIAKSKKKGGLIDFTPPTFNNEEDMLSISGKYVIFNISITEPELKGVYYAENSSNLKWRKICSSLKDGYCYKRIIFTSGNHDILVKAIDETGNSRTKEFLFNIE